MTILKTEEIKSDHFNSFHLNCKNRSTVGYVDGMNYMNEFDILFQIYVLF